MKKKDYHEKLIRYYEFQLGKMPNRAAFKQALKSTFSVEDLKVFFLLPFFGMQTEEKFRKKAARIGLEPDELIDSARRLIPAGVIDSYVDEKKGRMFGRAPFIALLEFQVRMQEDSPMRQVCAEVMNAYVEGTVDVIPTKTPYYRVLPVQATITGQSGGRQIPIGAVIPDKRGVLPIDVLSEMIKKEPLIVVADCYCRSTKKLLGEDCGHPLETCFYFNELALVKLEAGDYARKVTYEEAMKILWECEQAGLVHNVDNCEGQIATLCNCCMCSCAVMRSIERGQTNMGAPSRYTTNLIEDNCTLCGICVETCPVHALAIDDDRLSIDLHKCIGCGHCVSACPEAALHMQLREKQPRIMANNAALMGKITREAMIGLARKKILGK